MAIGLGVVRLLKNVPLDDTYTDTRWFQSSGEQEGFFQGKLKYSFKDISYQRVTNGIAYPRRAYTCRVPKVAGQLYDCNYMMFQNADSSKWFYAFIKQVNFINENNTEIVYVLDYLQSYMFELKIKPSFVEREHAYASEDEPFMNVIPEPVGVSTWCEDIASVKNIDMATVTGSSQNVIVVGFMPDDVISEAISGRGKLIDGVYSGASYTAFTSPGQVNNALLAIGVLGKSDNVIGVWMNKTTPKEGKTAQSKQADTGINVKNLTYSTRTGAYTIRNKKLLCSLFSKLQGHSMNGSVQEYKPELVVGDTLNGLVEWSASQGLEMCFIPAYENGTMSDQNIEYALWDNVQVQCAWHGYGWIHDGIKNALTTLQEKTQTAVQAGMMLSVPGAGAAMGATMMSSGTSTALAPQTTLPSAGGMRAQVGQMNGGTQDLNTYRTFGAGDIADIAKAFGNTKPDMHAGGGSQTLRFGANHCGFSFKRICPTSQELERLDTFFDMFGYQVNMLKMPNLKSRQCWNYVKLSKPCIFGSVPVEGMRIIKSAFQNGIRLWHVDAVGDYSQQNPPI